MSFWLSASTASTKHGPPALLRPENRCALPKALPAARARAKSRRRSPWVVSPRDAVTGCPAVHPGERYRAPTRRTDHAAPRPKQPLPTVRGGYLLRIANHRQSWLSSDGAETARRRSRLAPPDGARGLFDGDVLPTPGGLHYKPELKEIFAANDVLSSEVATFNATLQAGYLILAVRADGLAAGPMAGFDSDGIDSEFLSDGRLHSILVVNIGHPGKDPWFGWLPRLDHSDVVQRA